MTESNLPAKQTLQSIAGAWEGRQRKVKRCGHSHQAVCEACGHLEMHHDLPGGTCIIVMPGALNVMGNPPECPCPDYSPGDPVVFDD